MNVLFFLCPMIFLAGFVDSIAGGGGLISLTSYMACGIPGTVALGTNKFSSLIGCTIASGNYIKTRNYDIQTLVGAVVFALVGSWLGSSASMLIDPKVFSIIMLVSTPVIAVIVVLDKNYANHEKELSTTAAVIIGIAIGFIVGFYDGFYGPGAGMFMQMGFIFFAGINIKKAAGNARMVNWASNFAALVNFVRTDNVLYQVAIPCAVCSILGNYIGSRLAIKKDVKIIRPVMLCVIALLFVKILVDLI